MKTRDWVLGGLAAGLVGLRYAFNDSYFPIWLGNQEAIYATAAMGDGLAGWPRYFLLREWPVRAAYAFLGGPSEYAARFFPTLAYAALVVVGAYVGSRYAQAGLGSLVVASNPFLWIWSGRGLPDIYVALGASLVAYAALYETRRRGWVILGGLALCFLAKPVGFLAPLILLTKNPLKNARLVLGAYACLAVTFILGGNVQVLEYVVNRGELTQIRPWGAYAPGVVIFAMLYGCAGPTWLGYVKSSPSYWIPGVSMLLYACLDSFAPDGYYAIPGVALLALGAIQNVLRRDAWQVGALFLLAGLAAASLHGLYGDVFDDRAELLERVPAGASLTVAPQYRHLASFYAPSSQQVADGEYEVGFFDDGSAVDPPGCVVVARKYYDERMGVLWHCPSRWSHGSPSGVVPG